MAEADWRSHREPGFLGSVLASLLTSCMSFLGSWEKVPPTRGPKTIEAHPLRVGGQKSKIKVSPLHKAVTLCTHFMGGPFPCFFWSSLACGRIVATFSSSFIRTSLPCVCAMPVVGYRARLSSSLTSSSLDCACKDLFKIKSHPQIPAVRTWTFHLGNTTQPTTPAV